MPAELPQASGWRAVVKRLRRHVRAGSSRLLARLGGTRKPRRAPLASTTERIVVLRLNRRLGNILFLTPMLQALHRGFPQARIDVLIRDPQQAALLENLPGIGRVHVQSGSLRHDIALAWRLRLRRYDLAIDPCRNSTGNRIAMLVVGARQRLGYARADQWLRLDHAAANSSNPHQAAQAVDVLTGGIDGVDFGCFSHLLVAPTPSARQRAGEYWQRLFGTGTQQVIGFFTNATGRKRLNDDWWQRWLAALRQHRPQARLLQILPPGMQGQALADGVCTVCIRELDVLSAVLARLQVFVAADGGPMHLGAASGTPVVGLFKATPAAKYAPLGANCVALEGSSLTPEQAARETLKRVDG